MNKMGKTISLAAVCAVITGAALFLTPFRSQFAATDSISQSQPLKAPADGKINVAFVVSEDSDLMDISGPWEVFNDAMLTSKGRPWHLSDGNDMVMPFNTFTVSDSLQTIHAEGLKIVPDYAFDSVPKPKIIVIPAQGGRTDAQKKWLLANSADADVTMSVCTGASMLAAYGMLDGRTATTHHLYSSQIQKRYPAVHFENGTRWLDHGNIATAGGVTSGIDLALHIVDRYYGNEVARTTADFMEYRSGLWEHPEYDRITAVIPAK